MAEYQTHQKTLLIEFLSANSETPFTVEALADTLTERLGEDAPGKSTVYRIINKLVDDGTVKRFVQGNSRHFLYQIAGGEDCHHHLHLKCTECGKLLHMEHEMSEDILERIFGSSSFTVDQEATTLFGCCAECSKAKA